MRAVMGLADADRGGGACWTLRGPADVGRGDGQGRGALPGEPLPVGRLAPYASGFHALDRVNLDIRTGEIFALLGPNGAGKTTLIGIVCGIVKLGEGSVKVAGLTSSPTIVPCAP